MSVEFALNGLAVTQQLELPPAQDASAADVVSADGEIEISVSLAEMNTIFVFGVDGLDVDNVLASDISCAVVRANWPADISYSEVSVKESGVGVQGAPVIAGAANQTLKKDMVRHFANQLFGTPLVDLFNNEDELEDEVVEGDIDINSTHIAGESGVLSNAGTLSSPLHLAFGASEANLTNVLLGQCQQLAPERFTDDGNATDMLNSGNTPDSGLTGAHANYRNFLFQSSDKLSFKITYDYTGGAVAIGSASQDIGDRSYKVSLVMT